MNLRFAICDLRLLQNWRNGFRQKGAPFYAFGVCGALRGHHEIHAG